MLKKILSSVLLFTLILGIHSVSALTKKSVLNNYADIALAGYEDSLTTAEALHSAIKGLISNPSEASLSAAKAAWIMARHSSDSNHFGRLS